MSFDLLVVGCGLSGAVVARTWADRGKSVLILERRDHIGGNMYDFVDAHGILVHRYGPHAFHTTRAELFEYVGRYAEWDDYRLTCGTEIGGLVTPTPFNFQTIDDFYSSRDSKTLKMKLAQAFPGRELVTMTEVLRNRDSMIRGYAEFLFENDYRVYTAKQWGLDPSEVDPAVIDRVPLRCSYNQGYFDDPYQIMPRRGYSDFFTRLLDHPLVEVCLNIDALSHLEITDENVLRFDGTPIDCPCVYTGPLDELFRFRLGGLPYRSLHFEWHWDNAQSHQPFPVVAYPKAAGYTRITEYNKLPAQQARGTSYAIEYPLPYNPGGTMEPYYPILTQASKTKRSEYSSLAARVPNLFPCGRLADFRYYNMDHALDRALTVAHGLAVVFS